MIYTPNSKSIELRLMFEDLLYYESELLSNHRIEEWTELLHDDIRYWVPVRTNREPGQENFDRPYLMCHIDDNKMTLKMRAQRVAQGFSFADNPAPRSRHFVTNVRVTPGQGDNYLVTSNIIAWRSHVGLADHLLCGCRHDRWVPKGDGWLLIERKVLLDHDKIPGIGLLL
jgi:3-phenylpropionate/cinnamic acid dioxygenase small subunit